LVLSGNRIKGQKVIGTTTADASGVFHFHVTKPRLANGKYTFLVSSHGPAGTPDQLSSPLAFKVGAVPRVKAGAVKATAQARTVIRLHDDAAATQSASAANVAVIDEAISSVVRNRNLFRKKGS
jgi:hypothetical protein